MGKTVGKIALGVGLVALSLTGVGAIGASALAFALGVTGTTLATIGTVAASLALAAGTSVILKGAGTLAAGNGVSDATVSRLTLTLDPNTPRKMVFGQTALGTDIVYQETSGTNQEYVDYIIACAAHEVQSIDTIYSDGAVMWTSAGGVQGIYAGYLTVTPRLVGTSANGIAINGGTVWTSACTLTGCAYVHLRIKRTGNSTTKTDSPFSGGLPGRMTIIGKAMKVYDPRRDSTNGGSGAHRPGTQSTWEYTSGGTELGQNHALQALTALLGWRINGVVSVGAGLDPARIDFADWITAANICDETIALLPSGSQRRYEGAGIFTDADSIASVQSVLCLHMNAELRDVSGKLGIRVAHDDLTGLPSFGLADVLGAYSYDQYPSLAETANEVRGRYVDATTAGLYQMAPYPTQSETSVDGIDRPTTLDLSMCQDPTRAARIARQVLRRGLYAANFTADYGARAWGLNVGDPIAQTFAPAGLAAQAFRVSSQQIKVIITDDDAQTLCPLTLIAEDPWIYAWDGVVTLPPAAIPSIAYNPQNSPNAVKVGTDIGVANGATKNVVTRSGTAPASPVDGVDIWIDTSVTPNVTKYRVAGAWQVGANYVTQGTDIGVENGADVTAASQIVVVVPALVEYPADYLGNISGSISSESIRVSRGGVSIKTDTGTTYTITPNGGITGATVDNTTGSGTKGDISGITFGGNTGSIDCFVTVGGVALPRVTINFAKRLAAPPTGGGSGTKLQTDSSLSSITSTSYAAISRTMTVTIASGESLYASAPLDYEISGTTTAARTCTAKWQYSVAGANSWNDFPSSPITGSIASSGRYTGGEWIDPNPGFISLAQTKPTPGAGNWDVRIVALESATGRTMSFYGTATIEAKV